MPRKKHILFIITLVFISFSYKFYNYFSATLAQLTSFPHAKKDTNKHSITKNKEKITYSKATAAKQHIKVPYKQQNNHDNIRKVSANKCIGNLNSITTNTNAKNNTQGDTFVAGNNFKHYFEINTNLGNGYEDFLIELKLKLNSAFKSIEHQLGINLMKKIQLNYVFQSSRVDYEDYILKLGQSPIGNQGMYLSYKNLSIVELSNNKQGIEIAVHEAIHAFNHAYWGNSLRFFNEGMAQYFSVIRKNGLIPLFNFSWIEHQKYPLQISTLLFSETDWHSNNNQELYQNSKALFYFLMSNEKGKKVLLTMMKLEMKNRCTPLAKETIEKILFDIYPNHEQAFNYWFSDSLNEFLHKRNKGTFIK